MRQFSAQSVRISPCARVSSTCKIEVAAGIAARVSYASSLRHLQERVMDAAGCRHRHAGDRRAAANALAVALNVNAGCSNADLDLTLTTVGAIREIGQATNLAGATLYTFEQATVLGTFSGTYTGYTISPLAPAQPAATLIGSYAYVGTTPPTAATTAEFFVMSPARPVKFCCRVSALTALAQRPRCKRKQRSRFPRSTRPASRSRWRWFVVGVVCSATTQLTRGAKAWGPLLPGPLFCARVRKADRPLPQACLSW